MTQQVVNVGTVANDGTGDTARVAFGKVNANFSELYALPSGGSPAGSTNYIQYNASGAFAASIKYQWNDSANTMTFATGASSTTTYIKAAPTTTGNGNALAMVASDGSTDNGSDGGNITLTAGNGVGDYSSTGSVIGGTISLHAGYCDPAGFADYGLGGGIGITSGDGYGYSDGSGGLVYIRGGTGTGGFAGNGGGITLETGGSNTHASGDILFTTGNGYITTPGRIDFKIGGNSAIGISSNRQTTIYAGVSGTTLQVLGGSSGTTMSVSASATSGQPTLNLAATGAGNPALQITSSGTTGTSTASFTATNKPGTNAQTQPAIWLPIKIGNTTVYYIPCFAA